MGKEIFDNSLRLTKTSLQLSGIDLSKPGKSIDTSFLFYLNFIWLYSDVFGEFCCLYVFIKSGKTFNEMSLIAPFPLICVLATVKAASIFYNKDISVLVLNKLREIHPKAENKFKKSEERVLNKLLRTTDKLLLKLMLMMCIGVFFDITLFCVVPLVSMGLDYYQFGYTELKLPYYVEFFYDRSSELWWIVEYFHQVGSSLIVSVNLFGSDSLFYAFCLYVKMHFKLLCYHFERLTPAKDDTKKKLRGLILRHQELIELVNQIQIIFSSSMLFNIVISSFTICFCGFNITFIKDKGTVFAFFNFLMTSLYQIFMICFFGDMITTSSSEVSDAIYTSKWYEANPDVKKILFIIIMRSRKPCSLSAAKFATLNLTAFTKILSRSWSYFAVLKTRYR